jgi:hypothetical protein
MFLFSLLGRAKQWFYKDGFTRIRKLSTPKTSVPQPMPFVEEFPTFSRQH